MRDAVEQSVEARKKSAELLRDAADRIESGHKIPAAVYVQVFWTDLDVTRLRNVSEGFNLLNAHAIFGLLQDDLSDEIRGQS